MMSVFPTVPGLTKIVEIPVVGVRRFASGYV